jgi:GTP-binding protein Era
MSFKSGFVTLIGRPNVGKSTLINALIGQKVVIVSDKPQTTRNKIQCILTREDSQTVFIDTPGIHKPQHLLGERLIEETKSALDEVDAVLWLVEPTTEMGAGDKFILENFVKGLSTPVILVVNKTDLVDEQTLNRVALTYLGAFPFVGSVPVSAATGKNLDILMNEVERLLPEGPQYYPDDMIVDRPETFVVAEMVREQVFARTREEIPHSIAVAVDEMRPGTKEDQVYIHATIFVERESQKGIIIGRGGQMLRDVGTGARKEIENLLGSPVFLQLEVKVRAKWRDNAADLRTLGYEQNREW